MHAKDMIGAAVTEQLAPTTVTLAPSQVQAVDELARQLDRSRSYLVREALTRFLDTMRDESSATVTGMPRATRT